MADTQSILQLGIEAARGGDKAEARELFRLVTREDPNSAQGWLWLAGVAEDREEKRAALERVVQLDPSNDLARKGLAALGGASAARAAAPAPVAPTAPVPAPTTPPAPAAPPAPVSSSPIEDDTYDPFVTTPSRRGGAQVYEQPEQVGGYVPPTYSDDDYDLTDYQRQPVSQAADEPVADRDSYVVVDGEEPRRRGLGLFLPVLVIALLLFAFLAYYFLSNRGSNVAVDPGASAGAVASASAGAVGLASAPSDASGSSEATGLLESPVASTDASAAGAGTDASAAPDASATGEVAPSAEAAASPPPDTAASAPAVEASAAPPEASAAPAPSVEASAAPPAPGPVDVTAANPAIVGNDQLLRAGNLEFGFTGITNVATGSYGGAAPARGRYLIALMTIRNVGDAPAQIPDGFFVVKDAQGRVSDFNRAASIDYINRFGGTGPRGAGDYSADATLAPGALLGSIPLLFDVASDATDLVVFSRDNPAQGFLARANSQ